MNTYEIWIEGYTASGDSAPAKYVGTASASTFTGACAKALEEAGWDIKYYNSDYNTYWGCRLFDNETEARRRFG